MKAIIGLNAGILVMGAGDALNNPDIIALGVGIMLAGLLVTMVTSMR